MLLNFSTSKKTNEKSIVVLSCIISYILLAIVSLFRVKFFIWLPNNAIINSGISIIFGTIIICIFSILVNRKWFKRIIVKLFHKTINESIWRDVLDFENGSNLKIYLKNKDYYIIGHLKNIEEKDDNSWIALNSFAKFDINTNQNYKQEPSYIDREKVTIVIRLSDIEHIEIF